jgi:hypothetical protein
VNALAGVATIPALSKTIPATMVMSSAQALVGMIPLVMPPPEIGLRR